VKINIEHINSIKKVAESIEDKLQKDVLTTQEIQEINKEINVVLAEVGSYKRYFKRLI